MDIWLGVWIMVPDYGLSHRNVFSNHDSSYICYYASVSFILTHFKRPAFLWFTLYTQYIVNNNK